VNQAQDLFNLFKDILPLVTDWIDAYIQSHQQKAAPVTSFDFKRLGDYFSVALLSRSRVVLVDRVTLPPLSDMGLSFFSPFEHTPYSGITYKNTFFLAPDAHFRESTWFHEMVHVLQWDELGPELFLVTYAIGLLEKGYRDSPLEAMAYDLQSMFDENKKIVDIESRIRNKTRKIAQQADHVLEQMKPHPAVVSKYGGSNGNKIT
jgi:hypothetical protein